MDFALKALRFFMSNAKSITRRFYDRLSRHFHITQPPRQIRLIIYSPIHPFRCMKETLTNQVIKWLSFIVRAAAIRSSLRECRNENEFLVSAAPASFPAQVIFHRRTWSVLMRRQELITLLRGRRQSRVWKSLYYGEHLSFNAFPLSHFRQPHSQLCTMRTLLVISCVADV